MRIAELFRRKNAVWSFEVFPPKAQSGMDGINATLSELADLAPDYVSVTYSAGGSRNAHTAEVARKVRALGMEPLAHITCVNSTRQEVLSALENLKASGVENVLALRGDRVEGATSSDFCYASDLISFINSNGFDFDVSAACYPEGHPESESMLADVRHLKEKVDLGVTHLNSQLFFDNDDFFRFMDMVRLAGIDVPVQAGVMPLVKASQFGGIVKMTAAKIPSKMSRMYARFSDDPESLCEAGIAYATDQIIDLLSGGVDGVHLYIMNNAYVARRITENVRPFLEKLCSEKRS